MNILISLTYFRPHISGLTIYVDRLASALAGLGHSVTVLTSQFDKGLPLEENVDGVRIRRIPVAFRVSKGVVMPSLGLAATQEVSSHDVLSLHLPQLDAAGIAARGRIFKKPTLLTYHSDLRLPPGLINRAADLVVGGVNQAAARLSDAIVAYTDDFASHSPFLTKYRSKVRVIPPPVEVVSVSKSDIDHFKSEHTNGGPLIGMASRLAMEKGVQYLLGALPEVLKKFPGSKVLFAGPYENVLGEADYADSLKPALRKFEHEWEFLGVLNPSEMSIFYKACDLTVLPSINNTETFGLVQIESMICGTPVVASALPGVRQPVQTTGMGLNVPIENAAALAEAMCEVLENPQSFIADPDAISQKFAPTQIAKRYEEVFSELIEEQATA